MTDFTDRGAGAGEAGRAPDAVGVVVLGTGRSGTSAVARALLAAGCFAGRDSEMLGPAPSNAKGHFEPLPVLEYDEALLRRFGCSWWADAPSRSFLLPYRGEVVPRLREIVDDLVAAAGGAPVAIKEPRINGLLPLWEPVIEETPLHPLLTVRDPVEIALSHANRDGTSTAHALAAWEVQTTTVLDWLSGRPATIAPYGPIAEEPSLMTAVVEDVRGRLEAGRAARLRPQAAAEALSAGLRHERSTERLHRDYLTGRQAELWAYLSALPHGPAELAAPSELREPSEAAWALVKRQSESVLHYTRGVALEEKLERAERRLKEAGADSGER